MIDRHLGLRVLAPVAVLLAATACRDPERVAASAAPPVPASEAPSSSSPRRPPPDLDPPPPPAAAPPASTPLSEAELGAFFAKPANPVSAPVFETVLLRIATCRVEPGWVEKCPAYGDLMKLVTTHYRGGAGFPGEPALRHLRHPSYAVRATAVSFAASFAFEGPPNADHERLWLDALRSERDADVLRRLVAQSGPGAARNPKILDFVIRSLEHPVESVRVSALGVVARPDVVGRAPDAYAGLVAATGDDRPAGERAAACELVGKIDDARAVPLLTDLLGRSDLPDDVRGGCFAGLVGTWTGTPPPKAPSRDGYELTLRILEAKPRSSASPHERGIEALGAARLAPKAWEERVSGFYDAGAVSRALGSIVLDDDAGGRPRLYAAKTLAKLDRRDVIDPTLKELKRRGSELALLLADDIEKEMKREGFIRF